MYSISLVILILVGFIFFYIAKQYSKNTVHENMTTASQQELITLLQTKTAELETRIPIFKIGQIYQNATDSKIVISNGLSNPRNLNEVTLDISLTSPPIGEIGEIGGIGGIGGIGNIGGIGDSGNIGFWA